LCRRDDVPDQHDYQSTAATDAAARPMNKPAPIVEHWYQMRSSVFAALIVAVAVGIWSWTSNVVAELQGLRVSVDMLRHEGDGAETKRNREFYELQGAIVRDLNIDERRISALEACACRS
jgi:hypothetical protein